MSSDPKSAEHPHAPSGPRHAPPDQNPLRGGCPVAHTPAGGAPSASAGRMSGGCPVAPSPPGTKSEPAASADARSAAPSAHPFQFAKPQHFPGLVASGEDVPENSIPAAGRGNSEDGKAWLNPSANQLYRALMRKEKPIQAEDATAVAAVHVAVTDNTWAGVMEYESLHAKSVAATRARSAHANAAHLAPPRCCTRREKTRSAVTTGRLRVVTACKCAHAHSVCFALRSALLRFAALPCFAVADRARILPCPVSRAWTASTL